MTKKPIKKCPECKGAVERLIGTGAGIIFKGSGFYQTDYKNTKKDFTCPAQDKNKPSCKKCNLENKKE